MKKYLSAFFISLLLIVSLVGCGSRTAKGTTTVSGKTCYQIDLEGQAVEKYFTLIAPKGQVSVSSFNLNGGSGTTGGTVVRYAKISEGGWVAYRNDKVIYFPSGISESNVQLECGVLPSLKSSDCLTIEEVQEYLPWLS